MPIETEHHVPMGREQYRFRPRRERPLTARHLRACVAACGAVAAAVAVAGGTGVWIASWPVRWLCEPIVALLLVVLAAAGYDALTDLATEMQAKDPQPVVESSAGALSERWASSGNWQPVAPSTGRRLRAGPQPPNRDPVRHRTGGLKPTN